MNPQVTTEITSSTFAPPQNTSPVLNEDEEGMRNIVQLMIQNGGTVFDRAMRKAAEGGHRTIVEFLIQKSATDFDWKTRGEAEGGHREIVKDFVSPPSQSDFLCSVPNETSPTKPTLPDAWPEEPKAAEGELICSICGERAITTMCQPCRHACLCVTCSRELPKLECPICRTELEKIERIFINAF